mmetsp:Transcript_40434/g.133866  ORF Transcript_40434/g.133866 Transcript_40434/m.133866 type:complete len:204 (-) Transcript_40434:51-662(-)
MRSTSSDAAFLYTRSVFFRLRITSCVEFSSPATSAFLMLSWIGASAVAMKRVPRLTPSAPIARQAASCLPSPTPPLVTYGTESLRAAIGCRRKLPTSVSPGWPAQSNPSSEIMSQPIACALSAWRMVVHLWMMHTSGLPASSSRARVRVRGQGLGLIGLSGMIIARLAGGWLPRARLAHPCVRVVSNHRAAPRALSVLALAIP